MSTKKFFKGNLKASQGVVLLTMAGGSGTRFWPMSRCSRPKQFLPLTKSGKPLIEEAISRFEPLVGKDGAMVVTALSQVDLVKAAVPSASILAEPLPKNTAACLGLAAYYILNTLGDIPMICTPADHIVKGDNELRSVFKKACALAEKEDILITIGIKPSSPETGYGYIRRGSPYRASDNKSTGAFAVEQFVEKPNLSTAESYVESGDFYWNSGMFVWRPSVLLSAIESLLPETARITKKCASMIIDGTGSAEELYACYEELESISIDFGVMEEAKNVVVFPGHNFEWSDVGSWSSWFDSAISDNTDGFQNISKGDAIFVASEGCAVISSDMLPELGNPNKKKRLIAAVGLEDIIIVDTEDCLLICKKDEAQKVRQVVDILRERNRTELI